MFIAKISTAPWLLGLYWPLAAGVAGYGQGRLMPTLRTVPPDTDAARRNSAALHGWPTLAYFLPCLPLSLPLFLGEGMRGWVPLALAVLWRVALFDVALNAAEGRPLASVGFTASYDKLLRRLAPAHPERVATAARVLAALLGVGICWIK